MDSVTTTRETFDIIHTRVKEIEAERDALAAKVAELEADNEHQMQELYKAVEETNSWITKYNTQLEQVRVALRKKGQWDYDTLLEIKAILSKPDPPKEEP